MKYHLSESSTVELKREVPQKNQILKTIIGFCNQNGGKLVIGVDVDGKIVGVSEKDTQEMLESLHMYIYQSSLPPIIPLIYLQNIDEKILLVIEVSSGMNKPYYLKSKGLENGTYVRLGRSTVKANYDLIEELKWKSRGLSFDIMPVYHSKKEDLDENLIQEFLSSRIQVGSQIISNEILLSYHLIVKEHAQIYPSVAGVLMFGKNPQQFFSENIIICTHFKGISGREALAAKDCSGSLIKQFNDAYDFIVSRLNKSFVIDGAKRKEQLEIPPEAIREILVNAIVHRNYHIKAPIKIAIFDNRIEIFSPGCFPGPLDELSLTQGLTYIRNIAICKVFREAGYIEKLGSGFITVFDSYKKRGLEQPKVIEGTNFVKCILPRTLMSKNLENVTEDDDKKIMQIFEMADEVTISDIIKKTNFSRSKAGRKLADLVKAEKIIKIGSKGGTKYLRR